MDVHVQEVITGKDMLPSSSGWSAHLPWLPTTCEVATNNYVHYICPPLFLRVHTGVHSSLQPKRVT